MDDTSYPVGFTDKPNGASACASAASTTVSGDSLEALIERMNEASREEDRKRGALKVEMDQQNSETAVRMDKMEDALKHALTQCTRMEHTMTGLQSSANANAAAISDLASKNDNAFNLLMSKLDTLSGVTPTPTAAPTTVPYGPTNAGKRAGQRSSPFAQNHVVDIDAVTAIDVDADATTGTA